MTIQKQQLTLSAFIDSFYQERPALHRMHTSKLAFKQHYLRQYGISDYLRYYENLPLTHAATLELALHFMLDLSGDPTEVSDWLIRITDNACVQANDAVLDFPIGSWRVIRDQIQDVAAKTK
jgi:tagatose-1,6-bisphosphate aldolase non-catalytic subunit AgaZ/GatZ